MGVGITGVELQRLPVMLQRLFYASLFVIEVAQVKLGQRVFRVGLNGVAVIDFRLGEFPLAVINGAQVDQGAGSFGVEFGDSTIGLHGVFDRGAGLFQLQALLKPDFRFAEAVGRQFAVRKGLDAAQLTGIEIEKDLSADCLHFLAGHVNHNFLAVGCHAEFGKRLLHPVQLLAQRVQRPADLAHRDSFFAQFDDRLERDEVGESVRIAIRNQLLAAPTPQLPLGKSELAAHVRSRVFLLRTLLEHVPILTISS